MKTSLQFSRRDFIRTTIAGVVAAGGVPSLLAAEPAVPSVPLPMQPPFLTAAGDFVDVSRGNPKPFKLSLAAQVEARLTPETWRLEITADPYIEEPSVSVPATLERSLTLDSGNALDLPTLLELGKAHEVSFLKAMQCLNIDVPLGQGLWTGVPLRALLGLCGRMNNVRRIYYWGFHNNDPKQLFKSSVNYTQAMETAPGELPAFVAYRLNGEPISLLRGGPVRMIIPWSHGYKSVKWLQRITVTNDHRNQDTYANGNNDPDSYLKTAAYVDDGPETIPDGQPIVLTGKVISGLSGVKRVECWVRRVEGKPAPLADDAPELLRGPWVECELQSQPDWNAILPRGVSPKRLLGFDKTTGKPLTWPPRYSVIAYSATLGDLKPGQYEIRARAVDQNGFAQPEPRPTQKSGRNGIQVRRVTVV
jgi:hypothetical protein